LGDPILKIEVRKGPGTGVLTDVAQVTLSNPGGTIGVLRTDTNAAVVLSGTVMTRVAPGVYQYTLTPPAPGLTYEWWARVEETSGAMYHVKRVYVDSSASGIATSPGQSYIGRDQADAWAATLPLFGSYLTTPSDATRYAFLTAATRRLDSAARWQGRPVSDNQVLAFPRRDEHRITTSYGWTTALASLEPGVPDDVKWAVLHEAQSIAQGTRDRIANTIDAGLSSMTTGSLSESYNAALAAMPATLCRDARALIEKYRLRSGRLL
jgi:hypothetical protein